MLCRAAIFPCFLLHALRRVGPNAFCNSQYARLFARARVPSLPHSLLRTCYAPTTQLFSVYALPPSVRLLLGGAAWLRGCVLLTPLCCVHRTARIHTLTHRQVCQVQRWIPLVAETHYWWLRSCLSLGPQWYESKTLLLSLYSSAWSLRISSILSCGRKKTNFYISSCLRWMCTLGNGRNLETYVYWHNGCGFVCRLHPRIPLSS